MSAPVSPKVYIYLESASGGSREVSLRDKEDMKELNGLFRQVLDRLVQSGVIENDELEDANLSLGTRAVRIKRGDTVEAIALGDDVEIEALLGRIEPLMRQITQTGIGSMKMGVSSSRTGFTTGSSMAHQFERFGNPIDFLRRFGSALLAKLDPKKWFQFLRRLAYMEQFYTRFVARLEKKIEELEEAEKGDESKYLQQLKTLLENLGEKEHIDRFALCLAAGFEKGEDAKKFLEAEMLLEKQAQESILWTLIGRWSTEVDKPDAKYAESIEALFNEKPKNITLGGELVWKKRDGIGEDDGGKADFAQILPYFFQKKDAQPLRELLDELEREVDQEVADEIDAWKEEGSWNPDPSKLKNAQVSDLEGLAENGRQDWIERYYLRGALAYVDSFAKKEDESIDR